MSSNEAETIYERVAKLEDEVASLRNELDILKNALKNKLARHQIKLATNMRGSPSLVGRGIANSMFARTRGFESPSPRLLQVNLKMPNLSIF